MIQPKIDPLHEATRDVTVVIFEKDNTVFETGFAAEFVNFGSEISKSNGEAVSDCFFLIMDRWCEADKGPR